MALLAVLIIVSKWRKSIPLGPSFADDTAGLNRWLLTTGAPRGIRNYSTAAASSSPARACWTSSWPSSLLLSQPCLHFGRQPQHSIYELVPADVQQALLKAYDEQSTSDALPPPRKSNRRVPSLGNQATQTIQGCPYRAPFYYLFVRRTGFYNGTQTAKISINLADIIEKISINLAVIFEKVCIFAT